MSFSCQKGEFDRFFNQLDRPVEVSRPDRQPDRPVDPTGFHLWYVVYKAVVGKLYGPPRNLLNVISTQHLHQRQLELKFPFFTQQITHKKLFQATDCIHHLLTPIHTFVVCIHSHF